MSVQRQFVFWILSAAFLLLFLVVFHSILLPFVAGMEGEPVIAAR